jgi:hypothetical protein
MVNKDGWALTCRHVGAHLLNTETVNNRYASFKADYAAGQGKIKEKLLRKQLEQKYGFSEKAPVQIMNTFVNCVDTLTTLDIRSHAEADLSLIHFNGFSQLNVNSFPVFAKTTSDLKQGKHLCRLGYPFPQFTNFKLDASSDSIAWTSSGRSDSPQFPIDGMVTRFLSGAQGQIIGFELATPGLKGQSGGPAVDFEGRVWGMQSATNHLDLDFDVEQDVFRDGVKKRVRDNAFLHVGHCVHIDVIKDFMLANGVAFAEG